MSYATGTTHYNLPQTVGSDKRDWTDTNQAFSDIDAAIYGAAEGASAATSAIQTINGQIETITAAQAVDEGNISTLSGKVSTLESTVGTQAAAIADVRQDLQDNIESNHEASATSTHAYNVGDTFYYNDVLYKATASIAIGGTIVPSTNCTAVTVMSELARVEAEIPSAAGSVEVTADGVKTVAALLNDLVALVDASKITSQANLVYNVGGDILYANISRFVTGNILLTGYVQTGATLIVDTYTLRSESGAVTRNTIGSSGNAISDVSNTVPASGSKLTFNY